MPGFSFLVVSLLFLLAASFLSVMEPNSSAIGIILSEENWPKRKPGCSSPVSA
jgi:hypothetical protein